MNNEQIAQYQKSVEEWKINHTEKLKQFATQVNTEKEELRKEHQLEKEKLQKKCAMLLVEKDREMKRREAEFEKTLKQIKEWKENQDKRIKEALEKGPDNNNNNSESFIISFPKNWLNSSSREITEEDDENLSEKKKIQKKIYRLQVEVEQTTERLEQLRKANEFIPKFQQEIKQKTKQLHDLQKDLLSEQVKARKEKEVLLEEDDKISIVKERKKRLQLIGEIKKFKFTPIQSDPFEIASLRGPKEDGGLLNVGYAAGKSLSTYPLFEGKRLGDPICDRFHFVQLPNTIVAAVADGCGWGPDSMLAAATASDVFVNFMKENISKVTNSHTAALWMLRAFSQAHNKIISSRPHPEVIFSAGTTTMVAGVAFPLKSAQGTTGQKWGFVCANLGDCKAYFRSFKTGYIKDITKGNRINNDPKDPGGRLGPQLEGGLPDIRNLKIHYHECEPGDTISMVSDGVHDCLDPEHLGYLPSDANLKTPDNKWDSISNLEQIENAKVSWSEKFLTTLLKSSSNTTPAAITDELVSFAWQTTGKTREFMESNKNAKQPNNWKEYPGKMDHTTCLTFTIGNGIV